jgi:hypothetical protein
VDGDHDYKTQSKYSNKITTNNTILSEHLKNSIEKSYKEASNTEGMI